MYRKVGGQQYYLIAFIDEYSRYLVHWELLASVGASAISLAAQKAIETLPRDSEGELFQSPVIRSDNGSGYISQEFGSLLAFHGLTPHRIRPHFPEENGVMERSNRTLRESLEELEASNRYQAEEAIRKIVEHYNLHRLHRALGYKAPMVYYRGNPGGNRNQAAGEAANRSPPPQRTEPADSAINPIFRHPPKHHLAKHSVCAIAR